MLSEGQEKIKTVASGFNSELHEMAECYERDHCSSEDGNFADQRELVEGLKAGHIVDYLLACHRVGILTVDGI